MPVQVTGGRKFASFFRRVRAAQASSVKAIDFGVFATAKYPDGTPVASVAAWNEFGTERNGKQHVPERPAIRNAIRGAELDLVAVMKANIDPRTMALDAKTAGLLGQTMVGRVQRSITTLRVPPNAPSTIKAKGSSNPLIDVGVYRKSITYRVDK